MPPIAADTPVQFLPSVGPGRSKALAAAGIETAGDLLWFFPFRYEDRRHPTRIADLGRNVDTPVVLRGRVVSGGAKVSPVKRMRLFEALIVDGTGAVRLVWFNQPYLSDQIERGDNLAIYGTPRLSRNGLQIESPDWEKFDGADDDEGAIVAIYSKITNVPPKALRQIVAAALQAIPSIDDPLPAELRKRLGVIALA